MKTKKSVNCEITPKMSVDEMIAEYEAWEAAAREEEVAEGKKMAEMCEKAAAEEAVAAKEIQESIVAVEAIVKKLVAEKAEKAAEKTAQEATAKMTVVEKAREAIAKNQLREAINMLSDAIGAIQDVPKKNSEKIELYNLRAEAYFTFSQHQQTPSKSGEEANLKKALADYMESQDIDSTQDEVGAKIDKVRKELSRVEIEIRMELAGLPPVPPYEPSEVSGPSSIWSGQFKSMSAPSEDQPDDEEDAGVPVDLAQFYKPPTFQ